MTKKSNVHPDHYKTAGREPMGQGLVQELEKQALNRAQSEEKLRSDRTRKRRFPKPKTTSDTSKRANRPATTKASRLEPTSGGQS